MNRVIFLLATWLLAAESLAWASGPAPLYAPVPAMPTYGDATALSHRPHDRKIAYGEHPDQFGLLWLPDTDAAAQNPVVVFVHGGCWLEAYDITHTYPLATALAQQGYPVWNLEYRRSGEAGASWPASYADIQAGLRQLSSLAKYGVTANDVVIIGHSAGGHLALLAAAEWPELFPGEGPRASAIGLAAITDIERYALGDNSCQGATAQFMGGMPDSRPDAYAAANPSGRQLKIPVTLLHGDRDPIVPMDQFQPFIGKLVTKQLVPGAAHFDWIHPGTPAFRTLTELLRTLTPAENG